MRIAIIGAGNVGRALGTVWHRSGHDVVWCVRDPSAEKYQDLPGAPPSTIKEGIAGADVTVLAVPWSAVGEAAAALGPDFGGILIDCTNPIRSDFSGLENPAEGSGAARVKALLPKARIVKAFNHVGAAIMADADFGKAQALSLVCSSDEAAASLVKHLSDDIGFDSVVVRGLDHAAHMEHLAWLWISLAIKQQHGVDFAFGFVRR
ncbi:MAG: NAD(P)-binding domain-containing protein [Pseudomonadota bacterium]